MKKIEVVPYSEEWPRLYQAEVQAIAAVLGDNLVSIHHIGSTSVPGLAAKPKIDIVAEVKDGESTIDALRHAGYEYKGEWNIPFKFGYAKRDGVSVNLHVYEEGHPEVELNLRFRDFLRKNDAVRDEYASVKATLLQDETSFEKKKGQRFSGYNLGKDEFISQALKKAGFDRLRFLKCTHHNEWKAARDLRQKYFFGLASLDDPYTWTFDHKDHEHFVLYKGMDIIGYAHVQFWPEDRAAIRILVIDEAERGQSKGSLFLGLVEKWLAKSGVRSVHVQASPNAIKFYEGLGYTAMGFQDPDAFEGSPVDKELGKIL